METATTTTVLSSVNSESTSTNSRLRKKTRSHSFHCGASEATYYRDEGDRHGHALEIENTHFGANSNFPGVSSLISRNLYKNCEIATVAAESAAKETDGEHAKIFCFSRNLLFKF